MEVNVFTTIIRHELKLLFRMRVFRAFAFLGVVGIPLLQYFGQERLSLYYIRALSCSFPFMNAFLFNILQVPAMLFILGEVMMRERKTDSLEAIRCRPYSNMAGIAGKYLAVVLAFPGLGLLAMLPVLLFHFLLSDSPFVWWQYFFYEFTLVLPVTLFIAGLTVWVNTVVRIYFLALSLLSGMVVVLLAVFDRIYGSLDLLALSVPNVFSEVTGHVGLNLYLLQRGTMVLSGLSFLVLAVAAAPRLADRVKGPVRLNFVAGLLMIGGMVSGGIYYGHFRSEKLERKAYRDLYTAWDRLQRAEVIRHDLFYRQAGDRICVEDSLVLCYRGTGELKEVILYLNPGLELEAVENEEGPVAFERHQQVVVLKQKLMSGDSLGLRLSYAGRIEEGICYPDIEDRIYYGTAWSNCLWRFGKRRAMVTERYTFLTPECLWYAVSAPPVNPQKEWEDGQEFAGFRLTVCHDSLQRIISQGEARRETDKTIFENSYALPGLSLCLGPYQKKLFRVDSLDMEIYYFNPEGNFLSAFDFSERAAGYGLRSLSEDWKNRYGRMYPYRKLVIAEMPVAFCSYFRDWKAGTEFVQPEVVFVPENWCKNSSFLSVGSYVRQLAVRGLTVSDSLIGTEYLRAFFNREFMPSRYEFPALSFRDLVFARQQAMVENRNPVSIGPMFEEFTGRVVSGDFPGVDRLLRGLSVEDRRELIFSAGSVGPDLYHQAVACLRGRSLRDALQNPVASPDMTSIFQAESLFLSNYLASVVSRPALTAFLKEMSGRYIFRQISLEEYAQEFYQHFGIDLIPILHKIYDEPGLPLLLIRNIDQRLVAADNTETALLTFDVWNPTRKEGVVTCYAEEEGEGYYWKEVDNILIAGGECCRVSIPLECVKHKVILHTNLSAGLPGGYAGYFQDVTVQGGEIPPLRQALDKAAFLPAEGEIIVDNEDEGFHLYEGEQKGKLFRLRQNKEQDGYGSSVDFLTHNFSGWLKSLYVEAYGQEVRSFYGRVAGNGGGRAVWNADILEAGTYELYAYQLGLDNRFQHFGKIAYFYGVQQDELKVDIRVECSLSGERNIRIHENTGFTDEYSFLMPQRQGCDWVPLGTYELTEGEVSVSLYDRGIVSGQLIFADAVKWVKK